MEKYLLYLWDTGTVRWSLWARGERWRFFSPRGRPKQNQLSDVQKHKCHTLKIYINAVYSNAIAATEGHSVPASQQQQQRVLWWRMFGRGLVLALMGGLKAWLRSLPLSLSLSALPPCAVLLPWLVRVCVEVSEGCGDQKGLPALCVGNHDKPKHDTTHCSSVKSVEESSGLQITYITALGGLFPPNVQKSSSSLNPLSLVILLRLLFSGFSASTLIRKKMKDIFLWCSKHCKLFFRNSQATCLSKTQCPGHSGWSADLATISFH